MKEDKFLNLLEETLSGEVSGACLQENILYYKKYIQNEKINGKSEEEILDELGDPRLLAKTIIETNVFQNEQRKEQDRQSQYNFSDQEMEREAKRFHINFDEKEGWNLKYGRFKVNSWYGKATIAVVLLIVLFLIVKIMAFLLPVLIPVFLILILIAFFRGNNR